MLEEWDVVTYRMTTQGWLQCAIVDKNHLSQAAAMVKDKINLYHDFRDLIIDKNVDIVHIATPPHWHGIMSVETAKAGKDIFCEKHMTQSVKEKRVREAVALHGNIFRLNTWFRFKRQFLRVGYSGETTERTC